MMFDLKQNKILRLTLIGLAALVTIYILYLFYDIVIILALSVLFALVFDPLVTFFERKKIKRVYTTICIFAVIIVAFYFIYSIYFPYFVNQIDSLTDSLKKESIHQRILTMEKEIRKFFPFVQRGEVVQKAESYIGSIILDSFEKASTLLSNVFSVMAIVVIVPFITFYLLRDSRIILKGMLNVIPNKYFEMSYWVAKKVSEELGKFVRAWIFDATFVGTICGLGFYFLGLDNSFSLGIIAGFGHLVPYLGPFIGGVAALIISLIQYGDFSQAPAIIILILTVYTIDNGFFQPYVFSKSLNIHPIIIILLIVAGSQIGGILGMLLAVPVATVVRTATREIYFAIKNYKITQV